MIGGPHLIEGGLQPTTLTEFSVLLPLRPAPLGPQLCGGGAERGPAEGGWSAGGLAGPLEWEGRPRRGGGGAGGLRAGGLSRLRLGLGQQARKGEAQMR